MSGTNFPEWLNSNSVRNYPIRENAPRTDSAGIFTIPNSLIVGAQINYPTSFVGGTFFVSEILVSPSIITIWISYQAPDSSVGPVPISSVQVNVSTFTPYSYYAFVGSGVNSSILGSLAIGTLDETIEEGLGDFSFPATSTPFETNVQFVSVPALQAIEVYDTAGNLIYTATDVLKLQAGQNIRLSYSTLGTDAYGVIRIDAISGENLIQGNACANQQVLVAGPVMSINGVKPDINGNINLEGSECIQIVTDPATGGIQIVDLCSKSCCGCSQLEELTAALQQLQAQQTTLQNLINSTQGQQSEMLANLLSNII